MPIQIARAATDRHTKSGPQIAHLEATGHFSGAAIG
jgi:hypothetical protein